MPIRIPSALPAPHSRPSALLEIFYSVPHMGSAAWSQLIACLRILALRIGYHCVARSPVICPKSVGASDTYGLRWNTTPQDMRFASWSVRFRSSGELTSCGISLIHRNQENRESWINQLSLPFSGSCSVWLRRWTFQVMVSVSPWLTTKQWPAW